MEIYHKKHLQRNQDYKEYQHTIDSIQNALRREIPQLIQEFELTVQEATEIDEFVNDRATMFRFLRKNNYSLPTTLSLLLDTIRWRILADIDKIRVSTVTEFLTQPLVYFHKADKLNRPVLIVNLAYLPKAPVGYDVTEFLTPLVIFVLETARLLIWDMTKERTELGVIDPLIMETVVLVEFKNANALPTDITLLKSFIALLRRYPGMTGTVNLLNFGWMYQGLWQMCKLILSEDAKSKVNFPKVKDLKNLIEEKDLITEFGGKDEFIWNSMIDPYYAKYRPFIISRRNSNSSMYYDTIDPFTRPPSSFSVYGTPLGSLTPVASHTNLNSLAKAYSSLSLQSKIGNGMPPRLRSTIKTLFVTPTSSSSSTTDLIGGVPSWVLSEKLNAIHDETNNNNNNNNNKSWLLKLIMKCEHTVRYVTIRILKKMIRYKSTFYWMIACFLLRNGVQELIQHVFMLMMQVVLDFNSVRDTVGLRSILSLTNGQMTL
ncbi:CRAL-TRIO domain-containing protein [Thamnidium elegans]|nr:CRAL-TRIO domain-containing protein [Thamnidium elegans]